MVDLLAVFFTAGLWQFGAHYFPYEKILGRKLPRVVAYVIGVFGFILPAAVWMDTNGYYMSVIVLIGSVFSSGLVVSGLYLVDHAVDGAIRAQNAEEREEVLKESLLESYDQNER